MHFDLIIRHGTCMLPWGATETDLGVKDGRIASLRAAITDTADREIDARHLHVLPGMIDSHVHFRDPGDPSIESIATGSRGAALGGITTVFDMPNTTPSTTSAAAIRDKSAHAETTSLVDIALYVGATRANTPELATLERLPGICGIKLFAGSSTGDLMIEDDAGIEAVMRSGHRRIAFHSEDEYRLQARRALFEIGQAHEKHMEWRDVECAFLGTRRIVDLAHRTNRPAHILHVSTAEELDYLANHRDIASVEVLVNHLSQVAPECYEKLGALAVMNPPLRDRRHYEASWQAVRDGRVDVVSSDHAPHALAAKAKPWPTCPAGLTGVQTILPIMLDHVTQGRLSLSRLVDLMAAGPARIYGLMSKGRLAVGFDADFTIVDMQARREIRNEWIASPVGWTPFDGQTVTGWPMATVVRGHVVMRDDEIISHPVGRLARFAP
ncbi:dihydroorotase [Neoasaia chiangmaiensis]|uniref:Dihydroorotase n=1 Tax=Neoasaia chiangmaiensis TaxID=320497 RepID=A0A1U9KMK0_9PROT|nr:dihydroorotase [Neoasaia chiangmaiensis]AQS87005.1 dihydroorotase [Neoasaia chiangmaiensis]